MRTIVYSIAYAIEESERDIKESTTISIHIHPYPYIIDTIHIHVSQDRHKIKNSLHSNDSMCLAETNEDPPVRQFECPSASAMAIEMRAPGWNCETQFEVFVQRCFEQQ